MKRSAGFTLIEVLAGLLILGLVLTTSLAVFYERERRLRHAEEMILAWQSLANEAEVRRFVPYAGLIPGTTEGFLSDPALLASLDGAMPLVRIEQIEPGLKRLSIELRWNQGSRSAALAMLRSDAGGGSFW